MSTVPLTAPLGKSGSTMLVCDGITAYSAMAVPLGSRIVLAV